MYIYIYIYKERKTHKRIHREMHKIISLCKSNFLIYIIILYININRKEIFCSEFVLIATKSKRTSIWLRKLRFQKVNVKIKKVYYIH